MNAKCGVSKALIKKSCHPRITTNAVILSEHSESRDLRFGTLLNDGFNPCGI
jgi:hypothetical protein